MVAVESAASLTTAAAVRLLHQCSTQRDLSLGRSIHKMLLAQSEERSNAALAPVVANTLIDMYAKCGSVEEGRAVLESMAAPDVVSWTSLIWGYSQRGQIDQAMAMLATMQQHGVAPNSFTFGSILKACVEVETGAYIHRLVLVQAQCRRQRCLDVYVASALVSMYGSCGYVARAKEVFDAVPSDAKNIVTWSAMLCAYATAATGDHRRRSHGGGDDQTQNFGPSSPSPSSLVPSASSSGMALTPCSSSAAASSSSSAVLRRRGMELFSSFLNDGGLKMDKVMAIALVGICNDLTQARFCHSCVIEAGLAADPAVCNALIITYGRCGSSQHAWEVFSGMVRKDVVSWTAMIKAAGADDCLLLFREMLLEGVPPNELTLAEALHSCSLAPEVPATLALGKCVHACARELGYETDVFVGTSLLNMYAKCAALRQSAAMFQLLATVSRTNVVCWTAMITANANAGEWKHAVTLYRQMQLQGIAPNRVTFIAVLSACSTPEFGKLVHSCLLERGLESDTMVANAVVSMYGKCGSVEDAREVFERMERTRRDSVTWSAMLAAVAQAAELDSRSRNEQALLLFAKMQLEGVTPTKVTLVSLLDCCSDVNVGRMVHSRVLLLEPQSDNGNELDTALWNAIVNMYARCGSLESAAREFHRGYARRDFVSWNGMITASAQHSRWSDAVAYFREMQQDGVEPDEATMITLLFACDHGGFVEQGCDYFTSMSRDYGLSARVEHSACVLDMLGRAGHVGVAQEMLQASACSDPVLWTSLLGACRVHGDVEGAKAASEQILDADPGSSSAYVVLYQAQARVN